MTVPAFKFKLSELQMIFAQQADEEFLCRAVSEMMLVRGQYQDGISCSSKGLHCALFAAYPDEFLSPDALLPAYAAGYQRAYIMGWIRPHVRQMLKFPPTITTGTRRHRTELLKMLLGIEDRTIELRSFFDWRMRGIVSTSE